MCFAKHRLNSTRMVLVFLLVPEVVGCVYNSVLESVTRMAIVLVFLLVLLVDGFVLEIVT